MNLIIYEMKKSWLRMPVFVLLVLFSIINYCKYSSIYSTNGYLPDSGAADIKGGYYKYCNDYLCGEITPEKIKDAKVIYKKLTSDIYTGNYNLEFDENCLTGYKYGDYILFSAYIIPELEYAVTYSNISSSVTKQAYENVLFFKEWNNRAEISRNRYIYALYSDRSIRSFELTGWARSYLLYDFSSLLIMIAIIVGLSSSFSSEYESGMSSIIISTGKTNQTTNAKIISSFAYIFILTLLFTAEDLLTADHFTPIGALNVPAYYAEFFKYCPFNFSLLTAVILCALIRFLVFLVLGITTQIISLLTHNTIITASAMFGSIAALIALTSVYSGILDPVNVLSLHRYLTEFETISIFGEHFLTLYVIIVLYLILFISLVTILKIISKSKGRKCHA